MFYFDIISIFAGIDDFINEEEKECWFYNHDNDKEDNKKLEDQNNLKYRMDRTNKYYCWRKEIKNIEQLELDNNDMDPIYLHHIINAQYVLWKNGDVEKGEIYHHHIIMDFVHNVFSLPKNKNENKSSNIEKNYNHTIPLEL